MRFTPTRYWMLETVREYAAEVLEREEASPEMRQRHAEHFLALVSRGGSELSGGEVGIWLDALDHEIGNLRAALTWFGDAEQNDAQLDLVGSLWNFWRIRGSWPSQGRRWVDEALSRGRERSRRRALALSMAASFAGTLGDLL